MRAAGEFGETLRALGDVGVKLGVAASTCMFATIAGLAWPDPQM